MRRIAALVAILVGVALGMRALPTDSLRYELQEMADTASAPMLYRLSGVFERGLYEMQPDSVYALTLLRRAAEKEYAPALNLLGFKLLRGEGMAADTTAGLCLIERAADMGDPRSYNNLGWIYLQGEILPQNYEKAALWFTRAAEAGVPTAMAMLGDMHRDWLLQESDSLAIVRADSLYSAAIFSGLPDAQYKLLSLRKPYYATLPADTALQLGLKYYLHGGPAVGVELFRRAAELGSARAEALLGDAYSRALGVGYDHRRSLLHFYRAALAGDPSAQFVIAELLDLFPDALAELPSEELPPESERIADAEYWYELAATAGIDNAEKASLLLLEEP